MFSVKNLEIHNIDPLGVAAGIVDSIEQVINCSEIVCTFTFVPDGKPIRHDYEPQELQKWALSDIKPNGILSPLWVRPHPSQPGKYELVAGLRRLKAAVIVGLDTVPVKVFDWDDLNSDLAPFSIRPKKPGFSTINKGLQPSIFARNPVFDAGARYELTLSTQQYRKI